MKHVIWIIVATALLTSPMEAQRRRAIAPYPFSVQYLQWACQQYSWAPERIDRAADWLWAHRNDNPPIVPPFLSVERDRFAASRDLVAHLHAQDCRVDASYQFVGLDRSRELSISVGWMLWTSLQLDHTYGEGGW